MIRSVKLIYDFFRLWIKHGDRKEAWQDAKFINDEKIQNEMKELDENFNEFCKRQALVDKFADSQKQVDPEIGRAMNDFIKKGSKKPGKNRF